MWQRDYDRRLADWLSLRQQAADLSLTDCLQMINHWWQQSPWIPYYLHWDDRQDWPNAWQLIADNIYCDLARGLGMLYTVNMLDREDCADASLVETDLGNLVLVQQGKYVLNWTPDSVVNIPSKQPAIKTRLEPAVLDRSTR